MVIASFILGVAAVGVAGTSARYAKSQVSEMRRQFANSGPQIEVTSSKGFLFGVPGGDIQVGVTATNRGRGPANIKNWGFVFSEGEGQGGLLFGTLQQSNFGPRVPFVVAASMQRLGHLIGKS